MSEDKLFTCHKCGKDKKEGEGVMKFGGLKFCCDQCCQTEEDAKKGKGKDEPQVCKFC